MAFAINVDGLRLATVRLFCPTASLAWVQSSAAKDAHDGTLQVAQKLFRVARLFCPRNCDQVDVARQAAMNGERIAMFARDVAHRRDGKVQGFRADRRGQFNAGGIAEFLHGLADAGQPSFTR